MEKTRMFKTISPVVKGKLEKSEDVAGQARSAIFISHANPEDNEFTIWLGAHLSAIGYEVWADVLKIRGGEDWERKLEKALREKACKVLLVGTPWGVDKQGVRNEIQIAAQVSKKINDDKFVIPLRLQTYDSPFQIVQAQYIDFMKGWGQGLAELLETLNEYKVPRLTSFHAESTENWRAVQVIKARVVERIPENLISNWIRIVEWPNSIRHFEFRGAVDQDQAKNMLAGSKWPVFLFGRGFLTCAEQKDFQFEDGTPLPISFEKEWYFPHFLENGDHDRSISRQNARNIVTYLTKCALERKFSSRNLFCYEFSGGVSGWWVPSNLIPGDKITFKWESGPCGRRQLVGESTAGGSKYNWHFGVSGKPWISNNSHIRILPHIIFSQDGHRAIDDVKHMHRLRRKIPKLWRNERWRDMLLAFLFWLAKGEKHILLEISSTSAIKIEVPPMTMTCPASVKTEKSVEPEDIETDDPAFEVDYDEFIEDEDEGEKDFPFEDAEISGEAKE